jgi:hypothetical protein
MGVTNAVFGGADDAAVLAELTPPLNGVGRRKWSGYLGQQTIRSNEES